MALIEIENLDVEIAGRKILDNISLNVNEESILVILGPNGAGKTTLIRAVLGLEPYKGTVRVNAKIGYVPQNPSFKMPFPVTVRELFYINGIKKDNKAAEKLSQFGVDKLLDENINRLSGGELQRLFIVQELIKNPQVIIMDEPSSALDIEGQKTVFEMMENERKTNKTSFVVISHDVGMVSKYATDVVHLNKTICCHGKMDDAEVKSELEKIYGGSFTALHHDHRH